MNADGSRFVAVSTLDGSSSVRVFPYEFIGELPANAQAARAKPAAERTEEEKKLVQQFASKTSEPVVSLELPGVSLYTACFPSDHKPRCTCRQRRHGASAQSRNESHRGHVFPDRDHQRFEDATADVVNLKSANGLAQPLSSLPDPAKEKELLPSDKLLEIDVAPASVNSPASVTMRS